MLEIRCRVLAYGYDQFLGIVEGFPDVLTFSDTAERAVIDVTNAVEEHLRRLMEREGTLIQYDDHPTIRTVRLRLSGPLT